MICHTGKEVFLSDIMDKMMANKIDIPMRMLIRWYWGIYR